MMLGTGVCAGTGDAVTPSAVGSVGLPLGGADASTSRGAVGKGLGEGVGVTVGAAAGIAVGSAARS